MKLDQQHPRPQNRFSHALPTECSSAVAELSWTETRGCSPLPADSAFGFSWQSCFPTKWSSPQRETHLNRVSHHIQSPARAHCTEQCCCSWLLVNLHSCNITITQVLGKSKLQARYIWTPGYQQTGNNSWAPDLVHNPLYTTLSMTEMCFSLIPSSLSSLNIERIVLVAFSALLPVTGCPSGP